MSYDINIKRRCSVKYTDHSLLTARERKLIPSQCYLTLLGLGTSIYESKISLLLSAASVLNKTIRAKRVQCQHHRLCHAKPFVPTATDLKSCVVHSYRFVALPHSLHGPISRQHCGSGRGLLVFSLHIHP